MVRQGPIPAFAHSLIEYLAGAALIAAPLLLARYGILARERNRCMAEITLHARGEKYLFGRGTSNGWGPALHAAVDRILQQALKVKGLEYPRDYKILVIAGGSSANLQALQAGQIAATTVAIPLNYLAEELGFNVIGRLVDAVPDYEQTAIATKRSWAEKNRPLMVRFMKATASANRWPAPAGSFRSSRSHPRKSTSVPTGRLPYPATCAQNAPR